MMAWSTPWATATRMAHSGSNGSQPWGNGIPGFGSFIIGNNGMETRTTQVLLSAEKPYTKESGWGLTIAYTYTNATRRTPAMINEQYAFDYATIGDYPSLGSSVAKTGWWSRAIWTARGASCLGGKLTLSTPIPDQRDSMLWRTGHEHGQSRANHRIRLPGIARSRHRATVDS